MASTQFRMEHDFLGDREVPVDAYYGVQTLRHLLPPSLEYEAVRPFTYSLPAVQIDDAPRFAWRGAMLDVARHFFSVDEVKRYVDLQHARFADRLRVHYDIEDRCHELTVPTFLLQPLVENALRHGAAQQAATCHIQIGACTEAGRLRLWVKDDGAGLPRGFDLERDAGTGLSNTRSRLAQLYGAAASFDVRPGEAAGTIVEIAFPFSPPLAAAATT